MGPLVDALALHCIIFPFSAVLAFMCMPVAYSMWFAILMSSDNTVSISMSTGERTHFGISSGGVTIL
jgi:hypothetical protein